MGFDITQEDLELEEIFGNIKISKDNIYIEDEKKAIELIATLITNKPIPSTYFKNNLEKKINHLFSLMSEFTIENKMNFYDKFIDICSRLTEIQKHRKIKDKVVISFGGKVSAGKSKFINSVSGINVKLPVDQKTTTAIPTYIIRSDFNSIHANSIDGYSLKISPEALNAMAHEFDNVYGIGFTAFIDSIIVESNEYCLSEKIALLDTPGYTKYDKKSDSKKIISDRQKAYEQLNISDYLIWLIDIDSGTITEDDISFIESLKLDTQILFVFTKADLKSNKEIEKILEEANKTLAQTDINCFAITAYSSNLNKEYENDYINKFFNFTIREEKRNSDILSEFVNISIEMKSAIKKTSQESRNNAKKIFSYISDSNNIMEIQSLAYLWGRYNQEGYQLENFLRDYEIIIAEIKSDIKSLYLGRGESM